MTETSCHVVLRAVVIAPVLLLVMGGVAADDQGDENGACCLPWGQCITTTEDLCVLNNAVFQGAGSICDDIECPVLTCSNPDAGDCFEANPTPGCNDQQCCLIVCAIEPFCCEVGWDGICAAQAQAYCGPCTKVACTPGCLADLDGNGDVGPEDLASLLAAWNPNPSADALVNDRNLNVDLTIDAEDLAQLLAAWGPCPGSVSDEAEDCGESLNEGCAAPAASGSSCCEAHPAAGCDQRDCQVAVCLHDPACCEVQWDMLCANSAESLCGSLCDPSPDAFESIACGETVCGTIFADGTADVDWYEFDIDQPHMVTLVLVSDIPLVAASIRSASCPGVTLATPLSSACRERSTSVCLAPGVYRARVSPGISEHLRCDASANAYTLTLECSEPACTPSADSCADAIEIVDGDTYFSNSGASTDGLPVAPSCRDAIDITKDVWFTYVATQSGLLTVSTCNAATFNTRIAIYDGCNPLDCPPSNENLLACSDDAPGCSAGTSIATATVVASQCYHIRVGGPSGVTAIGVLNVTCNPGP